MIEKALTYVKQGYQAIKMQVAHVHTLAQDLENVRRMREAVGPDIDIMIDVNMGWDAATAIQMGRKFEERCQKLEYLYLVEFRTVADARKIYRNR